MSYTQQPIRFIPTLNPNTDETEQNTVGIIDAENIRFFNGGIEKIGGWVSLVIDKEIKGVPSSLLTFEKAQKTWTIIGTTSKLYALRGSNLYNITPLKTVAEATLGSNPLSVTSGLSTITVTYTAHGLAANDKIKLSGATDTGGILAANINKEFEVVSTPTVNTFTIKTNTNASSTTTGGGASVQIFKEIAAGEVDANNVSGAWIGEAWKIGLPAWQFQTNDALFTVPRIWWADTFGDIWVGGTGNSGGVYKWEGDETISASLITNAPTANWGWVEGARLCLLDNNTIYNSATGDFTVWTPSSSNSAYEDTKEDAINLISQINVNGINYVFDEFSKIFTLRWVGGSVKWIWQQVSSVIGIMAPYSRVERGGIVYFMGQDNIYYMNGNIIEPLPRNTIYKYIYDDVNITQKHKCFVWYNPKFDELWGHYPSKDTKANNRCFIFNLKDASWNRLTNLDRTAYDRAGEVFQTPLLTGSNNKIYRHEVGYNNDGAVLTSWFQTSFQSIQKGKFFTEIEGMELDAILDNNMTISLYGKERPQANAMLMANFAITPNSLAFDCIKETRYLSWKFLSSASNAYYRIGNYKQFINKGAEF